MHCRDTSNARALLEAKAEQTHAPNQSVVAVCARRRHVGLVHEVPADAVLLAVRSAKSWPIGRPFPAKSLVDKDGFGGVDGSFRFTRDGVAERLLEVRQVTAGGASTVSPAATKF